MLSKIFNYFICLILLTSFGYANQERSNFQPTAIEEIDDSVNQNISSIDPDCTDDLEIRVNQNDDQSVCNYYQNYPNNLVKAKYDSHRIASKTADNESFEVENGSQWKVHPRYRSVLKEWSDSLIDEVYIFRNTNWFWCNSCKYRIYNRTKNNIVYANLNAGAFMNHAKTYKVTAYDNVYGYIELTDCKQEENTYWKIYYKDIETFKKWQLNDTIIIGSNYEGWFSLVKYILICTEEDNNVRAEKLNYIPESILRIKNNY